ncbi:MAG: hypothetical protein Q9217_000402 [Psora testacea]
MLTLSGHTVTALLRNVDSIGSRKGLKKVNGNVLKKEDIDRAFTAGEIPTVVISTLNARRASESPFAKPISPPRLMADSNGNVVEAMKKYGTKKIVIMQALGVGDSFPNLLCVMRWIIRHSNMAAQFEDHAKVDQEIKASGVNYVLARPTRLTEEELKPVRFYGSQGAGIGGFAGISRKSVASFLVDAAEKDDWDRSTPVIAN